MMDDAVSLAADDEGELLHQLVSPAFAMSYPTIENRQIVPDHVFDVCDPVWRRGRFGERPVTFRLYRDVLVAEEGLVFTRDLRLVPGSRDGHSPEEIARGRAAAAAVLSRGELPGIPGTCVLCKKRGVDVFGHWLLEMFPKAVLAVENLTFPDLRFIVAETAGALAGVMDECLDWLGIGAADRVRLGNAAARVGRLVLIEGLTEHGGYMSPLAVAAVRRAARAVPPRSDPALYVTRLGVGRRLFQDEASVMKRAQLAGFTIFDPGRATMAQQVAMFAGARRIAGVLGSGLTDIVFAPPGAEVSVFVPANTLDTFFWFIAGLCGLRYREIRCELAGPAVSALPWDCPLAFPEGPGGTIFSPQPGGDALPPGFFPIPDDVLSTPFDQIVARFESLGDNCEFGLVQRAAGVEPLGFFRFSFSRLEALLRALDNQFADLADAGQIEIYRAEPNPEFMIRLRDYGFQYHTDRYVGQVEVAHLLRQQSRVLPPLAGKLLEDIRSGEKILVRKGQDSDRLEQVMPLFDMLRRYGPATLLWVVPEDAAHPVGTVEVLRPGLLKAYMDAFAPYHDAYQLSEAWLDICYGAYALWRGQAPAASVIRAAAAGVPAFARPPGSLATSARRQLTLSLQRPQTDAPARPAPSAPMAAMPPPHGHRQPMLTEISASLPPMPDGRARAERADFLPPATLDLPPFAFGMTDAPRQPIGEALRAEAAGATLSCAAVPAWTLRDVTVHGKFGVIFIDGTIIAESTRHLPPARLRAMFEDDGVLALPPRALGLRMPAAYHMLTGDPDDYYHWLIDGLCRFSAPLFAAMASVPQAPGGPVLLIPEMDVFWKWETVNSLVPAAVPRGALTADSMILVQRLLFVPEMSGAMMAPHPAIIDRFDALAAGCGHDPRAAGRGSRRLYLTPPADSPLRPANEDAVIGRLAQLGFTPVSIDTSPMPERVRLFAKASHIVAPHGTSLTSIGFCRPGTAICEVHPPAVPDWRYRRLAAIRGLQYGCLVGEPAAAAGWTPGDGWRIAPDALDALLRDDGFLNAPMT